MLAHTLGLSLGSAGAAAREMDELLTWRLLDNAHYIARLHDAGDLSQSDLASVVDDHELDSVTIIDRSGRIALRAGEEIPPGLVSRIFDASTGGADDVILGPSTEMGVDHLIGKTLHGLQQLREAPLVDEAHPVVRQDDGGRGGGVA